MSNDKRFDKVAKDPLFWSMPKKDKKVRVDSRFKKMFTDKRFRTTMGGEKADGRGRKQPTPVATGREVEEIYEKESDDDSEEEEVESEAESTSEESSSADADSEEEEVDHKWAERDSDVIELDDATSRLALCNIDWDRMKIDDIYMLCNSFIKSGGHLKNVAIFTSEFGKQQLAKEAREGPQIAKQKKDNDEKAQIENLRRYQLQRLKYFYAIVACDSAVTAREIYDELDGFEYESSSARIDLRFVPDEIDFVMDEAKQQLTERPVNYRPSKFITTALNQSAVELTWDETDKERQEKIRESFYKVVTDELTGDGLVDVSDSDEDGKDGSNANNADKYRSLLDNVPDEEEVKWPDDDESSSSDDDGFLLPRKPKPSDEPPSSKQENDDHDQKKKVSGKDRKAAKKKEKKKNVTEVDFNDQDTRFSALFESPDFNIDPTHADFKRTTAIDKINEIKNKRKRDSVAASGESNESNEIVRRLKDKEKKHLTAKNDDKVGKRTLNSDLNALKWIKKSKIA